MFHLDPLEVDFDELPLSKYDHPLVDEAFYALVQDAVRDVLNAYPHDGVAFVPEPSAQALAALLALTAGLRARKNRDGHPA